MAVELVSLKTVFLGSELEDLGWLWTKAAHDVASKIWVVAQETFIANIANFSGVDFSVPKYAQSSLRYIKFS